MLGAAADLDLCAETQRWLEEEARFPSTMVDRITPATSPATSPRSRRRRAWTTRGR